MQCFECDSSEEGQCTDGYPGHSKECEPGHGCMITLGRKYLIFYLCFDITVAETKVGKDDVLIRDCSEEYGNAEFDCNTINGEDAV